MGPKSVPYPGSFGLITLVGAWSVPERNCGLSSCRAGHGLGSLVLPNSKIGTFDISVATTLLYSGGDVYAVYAMFVLLKL